MSRLFACVFLVFASGWTHADATDDLLAVLDRIGSMQGQFLQEQYDDGNALVAESRGQFRLLRPGYFAWEITAPDSQLIIADPEYLWHHDRDLETVTRRPVDESEQMSPLQVLGGNATLLRDSFTVEHGVEDTYVLQPKGINPGFQRLLVTFSNGVFEGLEVADNLNQRIVIEFQGIDARTALAPKDFAFTPPDGADIFYYDE